MRKQILRVIKHPLSPFKIRTIYSIALVAALLAVGTEVMHLLEGWSYVDSFYFVSFIATAQGPSAIPRTYTAKIFASLFAFVSVGAVLSALAFIFGPLFGTLIKIGFEFVEKEEDRIEHRIKTDKESDRK